MKLALDRLDDWLVEGWRQAWRWWSVRFHIATGLVLELLQAAPVLPGEVRDLIPQPWGQIATAIWTMAGLYARVARQRGKASG